MKTARVFGFIGKGSRTFFLAATGVSILLITSGSSCQKDLYSLSVGQINTSGPQHPALIEFSPPQVLKRESLINDRLTESAHLIAGLTRADWNLQFSSQFARDISNISALTAQLGISFDPLAGLSARQGEEALRQQSRRNELANEIDILKLQASLLSAENQLKALQDGTSTEIKEASSTTPTSVSASTLSATLPGSQQAISDLAKAINDVQAKLSSLATRSGITASPEDHYEDLAAFRTRLRADLATVQLDDAHDLDGNSLFRLQFVSSIFPGAVKNRWGVSQFKIKPPRIDDHELRSLYYSWLAHQTKRMNWIRSPGGPIQQNWNYVQLGQNSDLYDSFELVFGKSAKSKGERVFFAVREGDAELLAEILGPNSDLIKTWIQRVQRERITPFCSGKETSEDLKEIFGVRLSLDLIQQGLNNSELPGLNKFENELNKRITPYNKLLDNLTRALRASESCKNAGSIALRNAAQSLPKRYCDQVLGVEVADQLLKQDGGNACGLNHGQAVDAYGNAYAYATQPTGRKQRLSSVASAANSIGLALGIAASMPGSNLGLNAGANSMNASIGKADAIERIPIVVGYATGKEEYIDAAEPGRASTFGWVFGPKLRLDTKENNYRLEHQLDSEDMYVDLSLPGWWSSILLEVNTAWVPGWASSKDIFHNAGDTPQTPKNSPPHEEPLSRHFLVRLQPTSADLDSFTDQIQAAYLRQRGGVQKARIYHVIPNTVKGCSGELTFVIRGSNLWRSPTVYLRGKPHKKLSILADMEGVAAMFDLESVPAIGQDKDFLTVVTRRGTDQYEVKLKRDCKVKIPKGTKITLPDGITIPTDE